MEKDNHNLCCAFSAKPPRFHPLQLVPLLVFGSVRSASAWQTRGRGFETVLMRHIFSGKNPGA